MTTTFILDDIRGIRLAMEDARWSVPMFTPEDTYALVRNIDDALDVVLKSATFDRWILDNDLGINKYGDREEGIDFLKLIMNTYPHKVPPFVRSCSANPDRREDIEAYFANWQKNGRQPLTPIGMEKP